MAATLEEAAESKDEEGTLAMIRVMTEAANSVGEASSQSWLGYQSRVYYEGFATPPAGAQFSIEWGFEDPFSGGTIGDWAEYRESDVLAEIKRRARGANLHEIERRSTDIAAVWSSARSDLQSIVAALDVAPDHFLEALITRVQEMKHHHAEDFARALRPGGGNISRDMAAMQGGFQVPPHTGLIARMASYGEAFTLARELRGITLKMASHIERKEKRKVRSDRIGTNVFIGHGRSRLWLELKDFIEGRLRLPADEFNRVPVAGITNIARLSEMLDSAAIALVVLTAEDEQADGKLRARMNVIHEVGLFQGRLGFTRAIVLLEEGCEEFSNINGLGQIRFPKDNISAAFESIRQVIEREGLLGGA